MGDRGSQFTERGDSADMRKVCLHLTQSFFSPLALGQVEHESDALVSRSLEQCRADHYRHATAVFVEELPFKRFADAGSGKLRQRAVVARLPFGGRQFSPTDSTGQEILAVVSHNTEKGFVGLKNP